MEQEDQDDPTVLSGHFNRLCIRLRIMEQIS